jgi:hypothetical protein
VLQLVLRRVIIRARGARLSDGLVAASGKTLGELSAAVKNHACVSVARGRRTMIMGHAFDSWGFTYGMRTENNMQAHDQTDAVLKSEHRYRAPAAWPWPLGAVPFGSAVARPPALASRPGVPSAGSIAAAPIMADGRSAEALPGEGPRGQLAMCVLCDTPHNWSSTKQSITCGGMSMIGVAVLF